jgi:large subunit ribosomal protein L24
MAKGGRDSFDYSVGAIMVSKQPQKQRLRTYTASLHKRHRFLSAPLSKELRQKYGFRSLPVRKGDKVRVLRGDFKRLEGEIIEVDTKRCVIKVAGASTKKADGSEVPRPIHPANVMIIKLAPDKRRDRVVERRSKIKATPEPQKLMDQKEG